MMEDCDYFIDDTGTTVSVACDTPLSMPTLDSTTYEVTAAFIIDSMYQCCSHNSLLTPTLTTPPSASDKAIQFTWSIMTAMDAIQGIYPSTTSTPIIIISLPTLISFLLVYLPQCSAPIRTCSPRSSTTA